MAAKLMGFDPLSIGYIRLATRPGWGRASRARSRSSATPTSREQNWHFKVGKTFHSFLAWLSWYGPTRHLQKLIFHTPLVSLTYPFSEIYHDYYRWPFRERHVYERWLEESPWGHLFAEYKRRGHLGSVRVTGTQRAIGGQTCCRRLARPLA